MLVVLQVGSLFVEIGTFFGGFWVVLFIIVAGLIIGIFIYVGYHFFIGRVEFIVIDME